MVEMAVCEKNPRNVDQLVWTTARVECQLKVGENVACLNASATERIDMNLFMLKFDHRF